MSDDITQLLKQLETGDPEAESRLFEVVYNELKRIASIRLAQFPPGQTLQPTALVSEAYLKLLSSNPSWDHRAHFFGAASRAIRNVLVDQARRKSAAKRGGDQKRVPLHENLSTPFEIEIEQIVDIDEALRKLEAEDERSARIVEYRFFAGLSEAETAQVMNISDRTVRREWAFARAWLRRELGGEESDAPADEDRD